MTAVGLGPGDEVIIPAHTYMATATSVLSAGAIPLIVDIDETITIDPAADRGRHRPAHPRRRSRSTCGAPPATWTRSWTIAAPPRPHRHRGRLPGRRRRLRGPQVRLDRPRRRFSFNYYKNMTCGEGGGVAVNDDALAERARCAIDPCHFYWQGRNDAVKPFCGNGARASELMGAMLNVQLDRLDGMIGAMRAGEEADPRGHPRRSVISA